MEYPRLPDPPGQADGEPADHYGARLVAWLLSCDGDMITATLDDGQARRAHIAATVALSQRIVLGLNGDRQESPAAVYDRLEALRRVLWATLSGRGLTQHDEPADAPGQADGDADGGSLVPRPAVPPRFPPTAGQVLPPTAGKVQIQF